MAWDRTSGTRRDLPDDWPARVAATKAAAGGRCEWILPSGRRCPRHGTEVDHYGQAWEHDKLRLLCTRHHAIRTAAQGLEARTKHKRKTPRSQGHPGRLRGQTGDP